LTKALSSFPESERFAVAKRRSSSKTGGLGFLAAEDAMKHFGKPKVRVVTVPSEELPEESRP